MKLPRFIERLFVKSNGETVRVEDGLKDLENGYFRKIGQYFKTAQILLFVLLFLFFTVFSLVNFESINYQNLYYFIKDFRTAVDNTEAVGDGIAYEVDDAPAFACFKGGLAVAGRERLQLLTAAGGMNTSTTLQMVSPVLSSTTDLLMVYGRGENTCHIYNSFTKIHSETVDGAVRTAYLSESGAYSVTAEDAEYASAVYVYNRNFEKLNKYNLNSHVVSAPLSEDGKTVAILSYVIEQGVYETRVRLARVGSDEVYCDYTVPGAFPLGISFTGKDHALMLTDNGIHIVSEKNGGVLLENFSERKVELFAFDSRGAAVFLSEEGIRGGTLKAYTSDGELRYSLDVSVPVRTLRVYGDSVFYRTDREIVRLSLKSGETESVTCTAYGGELLAVSEDRVLLCFDGAAEYYSFGA